MKPADVGAGQPVGVLGGGVEQREHGVEVAVGGRADRAAAGAGLAPPRTQPAALPDPPEHLLGALAVADRVAGQGEQGADPAQRRGLLRRQRGQRVGPAGGRRAQRLDQQRIAADPLGLRPFALRVRARPFARRGGGVQAQQAAAQAAHAHRVGRAQRRGEQRGGGVGVQLVGRAAKRSTISSGTTAGWRASGSSSGGAAIGTPAASSARRSAGSERRVERTSTAIRDHGTPPTRWARRSWSATQPASCAAEVNIRTATVPPSGTGSVGASPAAGSAAAARFRPGPEPGSRAASRRAGRPDGRRAPVVDAEHDRLRLDGPQTRPDRRRGS